jgi:hypothetical protein
MNTRLIKFDMRKAIEAMLRRILRSQWCRRCGALAEMIPAHEAANLVGTNLRVIYVWAEVGKLHHTSSRFGSLLVCANSLPPDEIVTDKLDRPCQPSF